MRADLFPKATDQELRDAYHRTGLQQLGYTYESAMANVMFNKVINDIVLAAKTHIKVKKQKAPAPLQQVLI